MKIIDKKLPTKQRELGVGDIFKGKTPYTAEIRHRIVVKIEDKYHTIDLADGERLVTKNSLKELSDHYEDICGETYEIVTDKVSLVIE